MNINLKDFTAFFQTSNSNAITTGISNKILTIPMSLILVKMTRILLLIKYMRYLKNDK